MLGFKSTSQSGLVLKFVLIGLSVILLTVVATTSVGFSQGPSPEVLQTLSQNPKLKFPHAILEAFADGSSTTRVIVILRDPSVQAQTQEKTTGSTAVNKNLRNVEVRQQLQDEVRAAQDRAIKTLNEERVRVTNRFTYIFGFSAEVTLDGLQDLLHTPDVVSVEEDTVIHAHLAQGIPLMNASTVRSTYNGSGIAIAICDSGIDYTHPRLGNGGFPNSKVIGGYDTGQNDTNPMDGNGHGTACAGIAAGNLGTTGDYIGGVAYNAKLYALKMTYTSTNGSAYTSDMVEAWEWCVTHQDDDPANPIMIISTSFGSGRYLNQSTCDAYSTAMTAAAANAKSVGITIFVSTGNDGLCNATGWPGCLSDVIGVGAVYDANIGRHPDLGYVGCIATESCVGYTSSCPCPEKCYVDVTTAADQVPTYSSSASFMGLFAPSNDAYTTDIVGAGGAESGDYNFEFGGTSAACPYAAGAGACLQAAAMAQTGGWLSPDQVEQYLVENGDSVTDPKAGITKPRVNLGKAVAALPEESCRTLTFDDLANSASVGTHYSGVTFSPGWMAWNSVGNPYYPPHSAPNVAYTHEVSNSITWDNDICLLKFFVSCVDLGGYTFTYTVYDATMNPLDVVTLNTSQTNTLVTFTKPGMRSLKVTGAGDWDNHQTLDSLNYCTQCFGGNVPAIWLLLAD